MLTQVKEVKQTSLKVINALNYNNVPLPPPRPVGNDGLYRTARGQWPTALLNINHVDSVIKYEANESWSTCLCTAYLPAQQN